LNIDGFIALYKPPGITSQQAVSRVKKILDCKKAGHTGTLDPSAEGLLLVAAGKATRLTEYFLTGDKGYRAEIMFGSATDTGDREGAVTESLDDFQISPRQINDILADFRGIITQVPPAASALKINGERAYRLFRQGRNPQLPARQVEIKSIQAVSLQDIKPDSPILTIDVICSKGTYIRSLAMDIGKALHCPAHLARLIRTSISGISVAQAASFADLEKDFRPWLLDLAVAVEKLPKLRLESREAQLFLHGRSLPRVAPEGETAVFSGTKLLGIALAAGGNIKPVKVLSRE